MIIRVIDVETTGLDTDKHARVVEIATVDLLLVDGQRWVRGESWSSLVNPGVAIPPEMSSVHHITDDMVADKPSLDAVVPQITVNAPTYYAAHQAKFEKHFLPMINQTKFICTRKAATTLWPDCPNHKNQTLRYWLGLKLADPAAAIPHRAAGDAYVTAAILRRMLATKLTDGKAVTPEWLLDVSSKPVLLTKLHFGKHAGEPCERIPSDYWKWVVDNIKDDEDVQYTAQTWQAHYRQAKRNRSPV